ncbi:hypothetical protein ABZP36_028819 [Zizania latifolia]
MDIMNRTPSESFMLHQLSCSGSKWTISTLPSCDSISSVETVSANQAMSCFFKIKEEAENSSCRSDMVLSHEGSTEEFNVSQSPITYFHSQVRYQHGMLAKQVVIIPSQNQTFNYFLIAHAIAVHSTRVLYGGLWKDLKQSEVFAVAFAVLAAGAVILTLNVLLLHGAPGQHIHSRGAAVNPVRKALALLIPVADFFQALVYPFFQLKCWSGASEEACTSTIEEDPHSSYPDSKAISTHSNSRSLCADPSTAEMEERCYVKLATENTPQECCKLSSTSGKYFKLYSAAGHISLKWVPVGKKDRVHSDAPETCAVEASNLTNDIPISANIDVENVPEANNEANKLAAEISNKPKSPGELNLRWQACSETGTDFNMIRKAVCDAYSAQQRVEDVQGIIGRPLADFEQFISSASAALYCNTWPPRRNFNSQEWIREGRLY